MLSHLVFLAAAGCFCVVVDRGDDGFLLGAASDVGYIVAAYLVAAVGSTVLDTLFGAHGPLRLTGSPHERTWEGTTIDPSWPITVMGHVGPR